MKVLFVSQTEKDIATVKRLFARGNHQLSIIDNAQGALALLTSSRYDVIIASQVLKDMVGAELLAHAAKQYPRAIRLFINDDTGQECKFAHQTFLSPLNATAFVEVIESFTRSHGAISKKQIVDAVAQVKTLPSPPKVYMQLNSLLQDKNCDSHKIAEVIIQDPALVAKVLQFVNSSAMAKGKQIKSIPDAITKMGVDTLCCIVMTAELFAYQPSIEGFSINDEQIHCLNVAKMAASIIKPELKLDTLLAGLLHDIGKLVLYEINPDLTKSFFKQADKVNDAAIEKRVFSTDHAQVGGYLLHQWHFPYTVIEAIVLHHSPAKLIRKSFGVPQAVYLANQLIKQQSVDSKFIAHYKLESVLEKLTLRAEKIRSLN